MFFSDLSNQHPQHCLIILRDDQHNDICSVKQIPFFAHEGSGGGLYLEDAKPWLPVKFASKTIKCSFTIVKLAVQTTGCALEFASVEYQGCNKFIKIALHNDQNAK